ncbi:FAD-dependent 2-octaprenylphenol hydroxylase [Xenorhabdus nematophila]|uniref:Monooxygenase, FAD/NAD(P)-binding domain n=1 Tax=Xenorhabdus nematophila (strain ATCC 19061 / DSM 3370 / CCUG 14189 / LMG 1036 / NCIMB 9965 / AN6) TaxID=406817 RepID=D3V8Y0_XENNA|nr:FAD-dependent 2-octaprenylphenol hydroxylase [Xenorhabdus nematophila]CEE94076.1 putative monooxygenase, FAD/NAD(P)-binding domain [Xenorhabdus nematophila str. Anatoliense]CEF30807.1 putative monooxygenase, FAD/NAD(P)-binding domain [Xenorhabdus nematophila str. Websteri]AYA40855.1 FAD-dependent 2-octaprenylphenol hydroxylase [Xenorhabdus nematophila]KHD28600.1 oxidoreductase [Xenorhabdus nematophila]MBA0019605.1 FAD-dependent 2-octaprenylphenol hydroxylase [Xenorhabdus nematophila]
MQSFDVVIAGGGMVGLALACGLQDSGLRIAIVEEHPPTKLFDTRDEHTLRVSAINAASERLLTHLGVWQHILSMRACPYQGMEVWDQDSFGRIQFQAAENGLTHLGHIIENHVIRQALWQHAESLSDVTIFTPSSLKNVAWGEKEAFITLSDGNMLTSRLVVGADGAHSWLRQHADIPQTFWDYEHHALVATIRTEEPHEGVARQVFHGDGILAFLPLSEPHLCSIVWSLPTESAQQRKAMEAERFNRQLSVTFDMRLGQCELISERQSIPLMGRYARNFAAHRLALLGDAAHTIHPLAGQGVNLGFMDVAELIGELNRLNQQGKDIGQYLYLGRYERRRKHSAAVMLAGMQGFRQLFDGNNPAKKLLRDIGLALANHLPGVKPQLLRHAMGLNDLPDWLTSQTSSVEKI